MVAEAARDNTAGISVVIPTHNRRRTLLRVIAAIEREFADFTEPGEVIVVDDGSTDGTSQATVRESSAGAIYVRQEQSGPAAARNRGAAIASKGLILFLGDDTVPTAGFIPHHYEAHQREPETIAVVGYTIWDEAAVKVTPFLRFVNEHGSQFAYARMRNARDAMYRFFYTSNASIEREIFFAAGGFNEAFTTAAWEDIEFAYRAERVTGVRVVFEPRAVALHDHPTSAAAFLQRTTAVGRATAVLVQMDHPLAPSPPSAKAVGMRRVRRWFMNQTLDWTVRVVDPLRIPLPNRIYRHVVRAYYEAGLREAYDHARRPVSS